MGVNFSLTLENRCFCGELGIVPLPTAKMKLWECVDRVCVRAINLEVPKLSFVWP